MNEKTQAGSYLCENLGDMIEAEAVWQKEHPKAVIKSRRPWNVDPKTNNGNAVRIDVVYTVRE